MKSALLQFYVAILFVGFTTILADTPANCTYDDIVGRWIFSVSASGGDNTLNCSKIDPVEMNLTFDLLYPDVAIDVEFGQQGFWTLIYNQGFEVVVGNRKYFAFSKYKQEGKNVTSYCDQTLPGWSHNVVGSDWACFSGKKTKAVTPRVSTQRQPKDDQLFKTDHDFIKRINAAQNSWIAGEYKEYEFMTLGQLKSRMGSPASMGGRKPKPAPVTKEVLQAVATLPQEFDWRNVDGQNFAGAVRNQASCGSCYAFASLEMIATRFRVISNNTFQPVFSPQEIVDCSEYAQGCAGGFPYLIAGKYAEDFGVVDENCYPYVGADGKCKKNSCKRYYATSYEYVGGYYGACNEELMKMELVRNGPIAVSFEVYDDFLAYRSGIYHHTFLRSGMNNFNPFELTNHAVLLIGYGADKTTGEKYWVVKNSWGTSWGEDGFFRIRRGFDECAIESIALQTFPIYP